MVQIVLIAESMRLQAMMATYGIQTQTPHQVEPVQIWSSAQLVKVYQHLGVNSKLHLQGRPARPVGALGTSKVSYLRSLSDHTLEKYLVWSPESEKSTLGTSQRSLILSRKSNYLSLTIIVALA